MLKDIEISPEMARLIQRHCAQRQVPVDREAARYVVETTVLELPPELELIVEADAALAEIAPLAKSIGVNDVVVNDKHIHIAVLDSEENLTIKNVLVGTEYLRPGTLVVKLDGIRSGAVIGSVRAEDWQNAQSKGNNNSELTIPFHVHADSHFDLTDFFKGLSQEAFSRADIKRKPTATECLSLLRDPDSLPLETQKQIISGLIDRNLRESVALVASSNKDEIIEVLR